MGSRPPPIATAWGAWEAKLQFAAGRTHYWESYIADMDRTKQQESVYEPLRRALGNFARGLANPAAWGMRDDRRLVLLPWRRAVRSGIMGKLFVAVLALSQCAGAMGLCGWGLARLARGAGGGGWTGQGGSALLSARAL